MAKAAYWTVTDVEARKRGEQTGLDTLVVHAVNDESGIPSVAVKCVDIRRNTSGEGGLLDDD